MARIPLIVASSLAGLGCLLSACSNETATPTGPDVAPSPAASLVSTPLNFRLVNTGGYHTCGVATDNRVYCWGLNDNGQLGIGNKLNRSRPTPVDKPLTFLQVDGGSYHTCGVTTDNLAYCWGLGSDGQLGFGGFRGRVRPVPVAGGLHFRMVSLGGSHSCGVTTDNLAYCWGANYAGQLGNGTTTRSPTPVAVAGGHRFRRVDAAGYTCGITTGDKIYCWGGDHLVPTLISSASFNSVSAGCAVTADNRGFCWDGYAQPQQVSGFSFKQLVQSGRACGVTTASKAYCWGSNFAGALGDGTETDRTAPTAVLGGINFSGVSPGLGYHTCGTNGAGRVYCWGHNAYGQLGLGTSTGPETCTQSSFVPCSRRPRAVVGP